MNTSIKNLALRVPGIKRLAWTITTSTTNLLSRVPIIRHLIWKRLLTERMTGTESLVSAVQSSAHGFDHYLIRGVAVPARSLVRMEVLWKEIAHRKTRLDAPLLWALQMYAIAKMGLQQNYLRSAEEMSCDKDDMAASNDMAGHSEIVECIKKRRSVRRWNDEEVGIRDVQQLIDIAKWAPSSCNLQPWKVLIITATDDKDFLTRYYQAKHNRFWTSAPLLLVVLANLGVYPDPRTPYVQLDGGAFIQNLLLLIHASGLSACWVGFTAWDNFGNCHIEQSEIDRFYARFGVPYDYLPISLIPVGCPAVWPKPPARKSLGEIIVSRTNAPNADL